MKNLIFLPWLVLSVTLLNAQTDTTKIDFGKNKIFIITDKSSNDTTVVISESQTDTSIVNNEDEDNPKKSKKFKSHWAGIGIGVNGYLNESNEFSPKSADNYLDLNQGKSWGVSLNFVEINIPIYKRYVGLATGIGFEFNNYRFLKNIVLMEDSNQLYAINDSLINYSKNKLMVPWVTVPLLVEFQIPTSEKRIHVAVGALGAVRIGGHTKTVYDYKGNDIQDKVKGEFHMNWLRYGLTAQIGYGKVGLYANYSLSSLFKTNEGPELYPWTAGFKFSF